MTLKKVYPIITKKQAIAEIYRLQGEYRAYLRCINIKKCEKIKQENLELIKNRINVLKGGFNIKEAELK